MTLPNRVFFRFSGRMAKFIPCMVRDRTPKGWNAPQGTKDNRPFQLKVDTSIGSMKMNLCNSCSVQITLENAIFSQTFRNNEGRRSGGEG